MLCRALGGELGFGGKCWSYGSLMLIGGAAKFRYCIQIKTFVQCVCSRGIERNSDVFFIFHTEIVSSKFRGTQKLAHFDTVKNLDKQNARY